MDLELEKGIDTRFQTLERGLDEVREDVAMLVLDVRSMISDTGYAPHISEHTCLRAERVLKEARENAQDSADAKDATGNGTAVVLGCGDEDEQDAQQPPVSEMDGTGDKEGSTPPVTPSDTESKNVQFWMAKALENNKDARTSRNSVYRVKQKLDRIIMSGQVWIPLHWIEGARKELDVRIDPMDAAMQPADGSVLNDIGWEKRMTRSYSEADPVTSYRSLGQATPELVKALEPESSIELARIYASAKAANDGATVQAVGIVLDMRDSARKVAPLSDAELDELMSKEPEHRMPQEAAKKLHEDLEKEIAKRKSGDVDPAKRRKEDRDAECRV